MSANAPQMSLSKLWSIGIALAVLFAPAVTSAAAAHAAVADHQMQMMETGHCQSMPSGHHDKADGKSCCISTYVGAAFAASAPSAETALAAVSPESVLPALHRPYLGEIATPPPRQS